MFQSTLLLDLPSYLQVDGIEITPQMFTVSLAVATAGAFCPLCQQLSHQVHSHYTRTLQDVPCTSKVLRLLVQIRRFFCRNPACSRKIFAERLPEFTTSYARRTSRCTLALTEIGFALGGKAGARLSCGLGLPTTRMTLLRMVRHATRPAEPTPRLLGVDEFAYRRGKTYGTILVDLERGVPVDLLSDRQAATFASWLKQHPGILLISRDRAGECAVGATQGAPTALQVADRYHLVKNLSEVAERVFSQHRKALQQIRFVPSSAASSSPLFVRYTRPERFQRKERTRQARQERYDQIHSLVAQGKTYRAIAQQLHVNWKTVATVAKAPTAPAHVSLPIRAGILAPYASYLYARWLEGCDNGVGLYREVVEKGSTGSRMTVERFLLGLRRMKQQNQAGTMSPTIVELTPHRAVGLLLKLSVKRTASENQALKQLGQLDPSLAQTQRLMHHFLLMVRERRGEELDGWLRAAFHSGIPEWRSFVHKLRQDQAAVQAGLILKWNNGPVEGQIHRLKLLKRSMYGRARFDLLKARVLPHHRKCA